MGRPVRPPRPTGAPVDAEAAAPAEEDAAAAPADASAAVEPAGQDAAAGDDGLLEFLLASGSLTQEQYDELAAREAEPADDDDDGPTVSIGPRGLRVRSADGEASMKVGGRIQADANFHTRQSALDEDDIQDGTELRRARFELQGTLPGELSWAAEVDFANDGTSIKDFWVARDLGNDVVATIGHQKQPFSLAVEMSSNDIPFVERSVDNYLIIPFVDRAVGVRVQGHTERVFVATGLFGESVEPEATGDEGYGAVGRLVFAPVADDERTVHLGVRGAWRVPDDGDTTIRIRDETTNMSNFRVVDTGDITDVDDVLLYGAEAVVVHGPAALGGEFNVARIDRAGEDYDFDSWHLQATYTLTGESLAKAYRIDAGEFKRLRAAEEDGRAWELAARLANIDVNDGSLSGGEEDALSVGLNCYYSRNLRFLFNWTHVLDTSGGGANTQGAEGLNVFTARAQLNF